MGAAPGIDVPGSFGNPVKITQLSGLVSCVGLAGMLKLSGQRKLMYMDTSHSV